MSKKPVEDEEAQLISLPAGIRIKAGGKEALPFMALQLMLAGIVLPTVLYSFKLSNPTPSQLLIAVCMALFSSVVFLWILDATNILRFRAEWVSKSTYGAAIASVLGTSVAVYRDAFDTRKYPYEGKWELTVSETGTEPGTNQYLVDHTLGLNYSESAEVYWGYSNAIMSENTNKAIWVEIKQFNPENSTVQMRLLFKDKPDMVIEQKLEIGKKERVLNSSGTQRYQVLLKRPN